MKDKMKAVAKKEVKGHEARMHGKKMAAGGKVKEFVNDMDEKLGGGKVREFVNDMNEKMGASRVKDMTGPKRNIGPNMNRVEKSDASLFKRLDTMGRDAVTRGKNKEKEAINSRTRSAPDYKCGGKVKGYAKGGGIEKKGKTKGKVI